MADEKGSQIAGPFDEHPHQADVHRQPDHRAVYLRDRAVVIGENDAFERPVPRRSFFQPAQAEFDGYNPDGHCFALQLKGGYHNLNPPLVARHETLP